MGMVAKVLTIKSHAYWRFFLKYPSNILLIFLFFGPSIGIGLGMLIRWLEADHNLPNEAIPLLVMAAILVFRFVETLLARLLRRRISLMITDRDEAVLVPR